MTYSSDFRRKVLSVREKETSRKRRDCMIVRGAIHDVIRNAKMAYLATE